MKRPKPSHTPVRQNQWHPEPIGYVQSCYPEKFGIPRQPGIVDSARGTLVIQPPYHQPAAFAGLEQFSHIWVLFLFHQAIRTDWKPSVRPPRLGGNQRLGVFASRAPFRPNNIGMSPLRLLSIECYPEQTLLQVSGLDLVEGTPILDIKPYVPYVDAIASAEGGYADQAPAQSLSVSFCEAAEAQCKRWEARLPQLRELILATLSNDPRPAYHRESRNPPSASPDTPVATANSPTPTSAEETPASEREYGIRLYQLNIRWRVRGLVAEVLTILPYQEGID